jgi:hypothetical protein
LVVVEPEELGYLMSVDVLCRHGAEEHEEEEVEGDTIDLTSRAH